MFNCALVCLLFRSCRIACEIAGMVWHCCHNDRLSKTVDNRAIKKAVGHKKYLRSTLHVLWGFFYSVKIAFFHMMTK